MPIPRRITRLTPFIRFVLNILYIENMKMVIFLSHRRSWLNILSLGFVIPILSAYYVYLYTGHYGKIYILDLQIIKKFKYLKITKLT